MKPKLKKCSTCKVKKPYSQFHLNRQTNDGYNYKCKSCRKKYEDETALHRKIYQDNYYKSKKGESINIYTSFNHANSIRSVDEKLRAIIENKVLSKEEKENELGTIIHVLGLLTVHKKYPEENLDYMIKKVDYYLGIK